MNMKKTIITALLALVAIAANAAVPDSIRQNLVDFDSVVYMAEHDYAPFKFKVTRKNAKEYSALKKQLVKDLTKGKRSWQDAVCAYVAWFGDFHFFVFGNKEVSANYSKYARKRIEYWTLMDEYHLNRCPARLTTIRGLFVSPLATTHKNGRSRVLANT